MRSSTLALPLLGLLAGLASAAATLHARYANMSSQASMPGRRELEACLAQKLPDDTYVHDNFLPDLLDRFAGETMTLQWISAEWMSAEKVLERRSMGGIVYEPLFMTREMAACLVGRKGIEVGMDKLLFEHVDRLQQEKKEKEQQAGKDAAQS